MPNLPHMPQADDGLLAEAFDQLIHKEWIAVRLLPDVVLVGFVVLDAVAEVLA